MLWSPYPKASNEMHKVLDNKKVQYKNGKKSKKTSYLGLPAKYNCHTWIIHLACAKISTF